MQKLLIINGHETYESSPGQLNRTMVEVMIEELKGKFEIKTSVLEEGYDIAEERQKFLEADVIIYQMPVFWFAAPSVLKKYMEEIFQIGVFYVRAPEYGRGGHLTDKKYMLSTTWNAPAEAFNTPGKFFDGRSVDEALIGFHLAQKYIGLQPLPSFACFNVVKDPQIEQFKNGLRQHLQQVFS